MTGELIQLVIPGMAQRGRRPSSPSEYREQFIARVKKAREEARPELSQAQVAEALTKAANRPISADTYRQWESKYLLPHDLIIPFCEITGADLYELLAGVPFRLRLGRRSAA